MERWVGVGSVEVVVAVLATMLMSFWGGAETYCVGWRRAGGREQTEWYCGAGGLVGGF